MTRGESARAVMEIRRELRLGKKAEEEREDKRD